MVLVVTQVGYLVRITGSIAEVLAEISDQKLTNVLWWTDGGTNAKALCSRLRT